MQNEHGLPQVLGQRLPLVKDVVKREVIQDLDSSSSACCILPAAKLAALIRVKILHLTTIDHMHVTQYAMKQLFAISK